MENKNKDTNKTENKQLNIDEKFQILQDNYAILEQKLEETTAKLTWYEEQFRLSKERQFGASSEKTLPDQQTLFNEAEKEARPEKEEPELDEITYKRKKKKGLKKNHLMIFQ